MSIQPYLWKSLNDGYHLTYFSNQNMISFFFLLPLIYAIFKSFAACPYSCVKRAPHAFSFDSTGSARVSSQVWLILLFFPFLVSLYVVRVLGLGPLPQYLLLYVLSLYYYTTSCTIFIYLYIILPRLRAYILNRWLWRKAHVASLAFYS